MDNWFYILKMLAGIGMFLFAMYLIEEALKNLSGRRFKKFLQKSAQNKIGAVAGGAIVTAVLQSSSLVSLMVLAFVGAGIFTMKNAIAIILGANLGTTIDSWIVATLGFDMNIEIIAYPAVCLGGLLLILAGDRAKVKYFSFFLLGFGLLFIGLNFLKTAMEAQVNNFDFSQYAGMPLLVYLGIGFMITLAVQSSSVTMALTLSALAAGAIEFTPAAAIILGSETGTTIKILLAGMGGTVNKKRVVLGNLIFNIFLTVFSFLFLHQILYLITDVFKISEPLIGLVAFSSLINLLSIAIFLPFLDPFTTFLERFYKKTDISTAAFISHANVAEPQTAIDLFRKEAEYFLQLSFLHNLSLFKIDSNLVKNTSEFEYYLKERKFITFNPHDKYDFLKQLQGEIQVFYLALNQKILPEQTAQLNQLISSVRSSMHAAKCMKDISLNISDLKHSSKDLKYEFYLKYQNDLRELYLKLNAILHQEVRANSNDFQVLYDSIVEDYVSSLNNFYKQAETGSLQELDITMIINFNREIFTSNKAILMAVKDLSINEKEALEFNEKLVYRT